MKKLIRSTNDLLLSVMMGSVSIFLLTSKKIITGVENGLLLGELCALPET